MQNLRYRLRLELLLLVDQLNTLEDSYFFSLLGYNRLKLQLQFNPILKINFKTILNFAFFTYPISFTLQTKFPSPIKILPPTLTLVGRFLYEQAIFVSSP